MRSNVRSSMRRPRRMISNLGRLRLAKVVSSALALAMAFGAESAQAQSALDQSFVEGFSLLRFEPAPAGDRFFVVNDASASDVPEIVRAMVLGHYTLKPTLVRVDADTGERREIVSSQLYTHLDLSLVPVKFLLFNVDAPIAVVQNGEGPAAPDSPAFGDIRVGARARVVGAEHAPFSFAPGVDVWLPTGSEDNLTGDGSFRVQPKLIASGRAGSFIYAVNGGFLLREYLDTGSLEVGNSLTYGVAAGVLLVDDKLQLGGELHGAGFVASKRDDNFASSNSPLEALFGLKFRAGDMQLGAGIGPGLADAPGTAPRVVASIAYAPATQYVPPSEQEQPFKPTPSDRDGDGIPDDQDACPDQAGVANAVGSLNGCPAVATKDGDNDGIADDQDACPAQAGVASDDPSHNGCPAAVADRDGDGIPDANDACPDQKGAQSADNTRNGCPEGPLDTDEDGISDDKDACPREAASRAPGAPTNGCPGPGPAEATFAGFQPAENGGATVFVQLTDSVKVEVVQGKGEVTYVMKGATVVVRNNKNPLVATEFDSSVARVQLVPEKDAVRLVVRLKADVKPTHRVVRQGRGAVLEVQVPPAPAGAAR